MDYLNRIIGEFEIHSVEGIKECFENGVNPNEFIRGKPLIFDLVNMYLRSPRFKLCIKAFVDYGLEFEDKLLLSLLLDDGEGLKSILDSHPEWIHNTYSFPCTFTPLKEASLLHLCAEYNLIETAKILVDYGLSVNVQSGIDPNGFGGHTPIFHSVNQNDNNSLEVLKLLILNKADLGITVKGLIWGEGYEWETFIPSVNPISYAMMGLLRQFQRNEEQIYEVVSLLMASHYGLDYFPKNVPNQYLKS